MPKLPEPINHTATAINDAHAALANDYDSAGVPVSQAAHECDRAIWHGLRWVSPPEQANGQRERRFRTGLQYERWLLDDLRAIGCEVLEIDEATGQQYRVEMAGGWLRGKADGKATGIIEAPKAEHVVECKSANDKTYRAIARHGVQKGKPDHYAQTQLYMHGLHLDRALYICANKNTDEIYCERLHYDAQLCVEIEARIERIANEARPPQRNEGFWCGFCQHADACLNGVFARANCRTCLHATPAAVGGMDWHCARWDAAKTYGEQREGCPAHRFIPDLVPGEQIDVDGDEVVYRLANGREWRDGEAV